MWVSGQGLAAASLPPGKTRYPLHRRLGGPQGWSGRVQKISSPTRIRSPDHLARSESLYRLSYPGLQRPVRGCVKLTAFCDAYQLCNPKNFVGKMDNFSIPPPTAGHPRHQKLDTPDTNNWTPQTSKAGHPRHQQLDTTDTNSWTPQTPTARHPRHQQANSSLLLHRAFCRIILIITPTNALT